MGSHHKYDYATILIDQDDLNICRNSRSLDNSGFTVRQALGYEGQRNLRNSNACDYYYYYTIFRGYLRNPFPSRYSHLLLDDNSTLSDNMTVDTHLDSVTVATPTNTNCDCFS